MKERVLIKQNVFTCVMFGAILTFVLYESFFYRMDLSVLAFFIAVPTFILSILKLVVDMLEDINDKITSFLQHTENLDCYDYDILEAIRDRDESDVVGIVDEFCGDNQELAWRKEELLKYHEARISRTRIRKIRRAILYVYYLIFMIMFILLLLHSELSIFIQNGISRTIDLNIFTIWSLIIILLEIMMKSIFEDLFFLYLERKIGIDLQWY